MWGTTPQGGGGKKKKRDPAIRLYTEGHGGRGEGVTGTFGKKQDVTILVYRGELHKMRMKEGRGDQ